MYDVEGFMKYIEPKLKQASCSSYKSGLNSIEKKYGKSLDDEFRRFGGLSV